ncbi:urea ABC transporter ATP-binding protein UrtD [Sorangium atrum]|uniref:Urea ABC transporter ATP-binding protein UrtD n=1 Tax=Sorangium atrum TaxID=2995308 RepID=A0ABT5BVS1_9BACT|nr:urea ABC transporter ATP-binding protein UrtD [Sorangium aterium]MDC0677793.1 urea ABC transporter ATP-binding protein UrtD [Sorangium aterium]
MSRNERGDDERSSAMSRGNIVEVQRVTVSFDGFKVLDELDFSIQRGELRFLIGPNGAGKTTLLDILTGKTKPSSGRVVFHGGGESGQESVEVNRLPEHALVRLGIGRKFQTPAVFGSLTVLENLEAAMGFRESAPGLLRGLSAQQEREISETLDRVGLRRRADVRAAVLAHGERQWLEIGMLLVQQPKLLLLDEPVAGMTRRERDRTGELVQEIAKQRSVLVVEHDMEFVRRYASTVTVLHAGRRLCEGPVEEVQRDSKVIEVYLGRAHDAGHARGGAKAPVEAQAEER